jgi:hypothetical protein
MSTEPKADKLEALLTRLVTALQMRESGLDGKMGQPHLSAVLVEIAEELRVLQAETK